MADVAYHFDGQPDTTPQTPTNTGASTVQVTAGGSATFATSTANTGGTGGKWVNVVSGFAYSRLATAASSLLTSFHGILTTPASSAGSPWLATCRESAAQKWKLVRQSSDGRCYLIDTTASGQPFGYIKATGSTTTDLVLSASTKYRIEIQTTIDGTTATSGAIDIQIYTQSGTTALNNTTHLSSHTGTTANLGTAAAVAYDVGIASTSTTSHDVGWDEVIIRSGAATIIGPWTPPTNTPPVVTAPANQRIASGAAVSLTMTATDSDGTIAAYRWANLSRPTGAASIADQTTATGSYTLSTPGLYTFAPSATDDGGLTTTGTTVTVYVYAVDGSSKPRSIRTTTWTGVVGNVTDTDVSGSETYIESTSAPANVPVILDMDPIGNGDIVIDGFNARLQPSGGAPSTCKIEILGGGVGVDTVIKTQTVTMTASFVNTTITLTSGENTAMTTTFRNLWAIRLTANQT